jgi:PBP1b-binding outer membrane lipoprotein LpoB
MKKIVTILTLAVVLFAGATANAATKHHKHHHKPQPTEPADPDTDDGGE